MCKIYHPHLLKNTYKLAVELSRYSDFCQSCAKYLFLMPNTLFTFGLKTQGGKVLLEYIDLPTISGLTAISPGRPELKVMQVVVTTESYKTCKAPVKSSPSTNQYPTFFTGRMPFLSSSQQCQST